jgi:hypothetical protein
MAENLFARNGALRKDSTEGNKGNEANKPGIVALVSFVGFCSIACFVHDPAFAIAHCVYSFHTGATDATVLPTAI